MSEVQLVVSVHLYFVIVFWQHVGACFLLCLLLHLNLCVVNTDISYFADTLHTCRNVCVLKHRLNMLGLRNWNWDLELCHLSSTSIHVMGHIRRSFKRNVR